MIPVVDRLEHPINTHIDPRGSTADDRSATTYRMVMLCQYGINTLGLAIAAVLNWVSVPVALFIGAVEPPRSSRRSASTSEG